MEFIALDNRYDKMHYRRCGNSGINLPVLSVGLWHNFGGVDDFETGREIVRAAFDQGITHFDLANNYGPPPGSAESNFGKILKKDLKPYRDELIISSKAGYLMWPGPYGDNGSRKYLLASLDQSLERMHLDYVDIFYSHRYDPLTPLEETMGALAQAVRSGKALYAGISNYPPDETREAARILGEMGTPCLIHQVKYSLFRREAEEGLAAVLRKKKIGCIAFSPLAQGLLTNRYLDGIPSDSRAGKPHGFLKIDQITPEIQAIVGKLNETARSLDMTLAELALNWVKSHDFITSVLIGVSTKQQLDTNLRILDLPNFTPDQIQAINSCLTETT
ncbi:MAG: aldo/keto reductase [Bacteroidia bacterium]|nr:aldo/keto reductase [Bacteroidia bacterium]